jgi:NADPH2:quinone reductase
VKAIRVDAPGEPEAMHLAADVFGWIAAGKLKVRVFGELPLARAGEAHRLLESRQTSGKLLLIP